MARRVLRIGGKTIRGDPIAKLDYFAAVDDQHVNDKLNGAKRARDDYSSKSQHVRRMESRMGPQTCKQRKINILQHNAISTPTHNARW